ncbi:MAG: T9SS type A sorting domain-containing protein [Bacteroidales bacterium]|nr:T9SS type A sorting domain-containing protein [Bacteroidales bacterium]
MRKTFLLMFALLLTTTIFAQEGPSNIIISETFDSASLPEGWTTMGPDGNASSNWSISNTNYAGGSSNEAHLGWSPQFSGKNRLVSPPVNLTGIQEIVISMNHYFENYNSAYNTIGVATSSDYGYTWHSVWEKAYSETGQYSIEEKILSPDMGYENVLFCIYYDGSSLNFKNWYFDDFIVKIQDDLAININSININERLGSGPLNVSFEVQNMGSTAITSIEASYQIDNQETVSETFSVYMTNFEANTLSFSTTETLLPGTYNITINIDKANGWELEDDYTHSLSKQFSISIAQTQRIPMIEHFSSSTCAPCVLINMLMHNLTEANPGKFTYVKYPVNWPSMGDPYYIPECYDRVLYYNVSTAPLVFLDAVAQVSNQTAQPVTNSALMARYNTPAFADIRGAFNMEGSVLNGIVDVMSYIDLTSAKAFISINEKTTTGNVGSNGETEFHHITLKMINEGEGVDVTLNAGDYQRYLFSYDMSETYAEEMDDLEVAVWLQDPETKEIFNSHFLYEYDEHPYPARNVRFTSGNTLKISWDAPEMGQPTGYDLYVNNSLMLSNTTQTSFNVNAADFCLAEVVALYGEKSSVSAVKIHSSQFEIPQNLTAEVGDGNITVSWDATENASGYNLYCNGIKITDINSNTSEYVLGDVENGVEYCFQISADYDNYESASSEEVCVVYTDIDEIESEIFVTPNPADNFVRISGANVKEVNIYNSLGILVDRFNVEDNIVNVNVEDYSSGVYFVNIKTHQENIIKKIIIK